MNHEHEQGHTGSKPAESTHSNVDSVEPGQLSRSALLRKHENATRSGLLLRKARNASGVADGAEHAVATAATSSGSPLPDALRPKFENSLGADLSGVRVHMGEDSAHAAAAVGARAYTIGQDIYFGVDQFNTASTEGQRLIAHEVAHTVQQTGGLSGLQSKLEVSAPHDTLEIEAEVASDRMLSGELAQVSQGVGVQRKIMCDAMPTETGLEHTETQMDRQATVSETEMRTAIRENPPVVSTLGVTFGECHAHNLMVQIREAQPHIREGARDGTEGCATQANLTVNEQTIQHLQEYINASQDQRSTLGQFQAHNERLTIDYARIQGQVAGLRNSDQGPDLDGVDLPHRQFADTIILSASGGTMESLHEAFLAANAGGNPARRNPAVNSNSVAVEYRRTDLERVSREVGMNEQAASSAEADARSAHSALINVVATQQAQGVENHIAALRAAAAAMKEKIDLAAGFVQGFIKRDVSEVAVASFNLAGYLATNHYDDQIDQLDAQLQDLTLQSNIAAITVARDHALHTKRAWERAGQAYVDKIADQQRLRTELNTHMRNLGAALDRDDYGNSFTIILQVLSECDQWLAQCTTTLQIGRSEMARADETNGAIRVVVYYWPFQFGHLGRLRWGARRVTDYPDRDEVQRANRLISNRMQEIEGQELYVRACATRLRQVFAARGT